jgi:hypothetical protein
MLDADRRIETPQTRTILGRDYFSRDALMYRGGETAP